MIHLTQTRVVWTWSNTAEKHMKLKGCYTHRSSRGTCMSRRAGCTWEEPGSREREGEDLWSGAFRGQGRAHTQKRERVSPNPRRRGQAGEPVAGTSRVSLVHAVSRAGARSLGVRLLRHRESIVLRTYSSLGNVSSKCTGLRVHAEEEPWRSVDVSFRWNPLSQRCYCKTRVSMRGGGGQSVSSLPSL